MNSFLEVTQLERAEPGLEPSSDCLWTTPGDSVKALSVETNLVVCVQILIPTYRGAKPRLKAWTPTVIINHHSSRFLWVAIHLILREEIYPLLFMFLTPAYPGRPADASDLPGIFMLSKNSSGLWFFYKDCFF